MKEVRIYTNGSGVILGVRNDDGLVINGYKPAETDFEPQCVTEFWSCNLPLLKSLEYTGNLSMEERQREIARELDAIKTEYPEVLFKLNNKSQ